MKAQNVLLSVVVVGFAGILMSPAQISAQKPRYKVVDLGTLGGPISYGSLNSLGDNLLNDSGAVAAHADLAVPDPNASFFCFDPDCFQAHAFQWKNGVMTDLGALPENNNSAAGSINSLGWATGQSQSSTIDPVFGFPEFRAVLWKHGQIIDLGTLGSGTESLGVWVNDAGQVIGLSTINTEPDPFGFFFSRTPSSGKTVRSWILEPWGAARPAPEAVAVIRRKEWYGEYRPRLRRQIQTLAFPPPIPFCGTTER